MFSCRDLVRVIYLAHCSTHQVESSDIRAFIPSSPVSASAHRLPLSVSHRVYTFSLISSDVVIRPVRDIAYIRKVIAQKSRLHKSDEHSSHSPRLQAGRVENQRLCALIFDVGKCNFASSGRHITVLLCAV